jgi:hypothetical protein
MYNKIDELKKAGESEEAAALAEECGRIKVKKTFLLNAANKNGEVGMFEITKTAHDQLIELMREYLNKYGKNPTSLKDGVWFVFSRSGKGFNTEYKVSMNRTIITLEDGDQVEKVDRTPLAANIVENYEKLAYDIHVMYKPIFSGDLQRILDGEKIDEVIKYEKVTRKPVEEAEVELVLEEEPVKVEIKEPVKKAAAPVKAKVEAPVAATVSEDEEDWMKMLNT